MRMDILDFAFASASRGTSSLDFAGILHLRMPIVLAALQAGALRAFAQYPVSACRAEGRSWLPDDSPWSIEELSVTGTAARDQAIEEFLARPLDLRKKRGVRQLLVHCAPRKSGEAPSLPAQATLVAQMHHAVGDGLSLLLWLGAQLSGRSDGLGSLQLKTHHRPVGKSPLAFGSPSDRLRVGETTRRHKVRPTRVRRWSTFDLRQATRQFSEKSFTYNDLISSALLRAIREWNAAGAGSSGETPRLSLWIPMNIRKVPFQGFGNGSSRIRLYDRYPVSDGYLALAHALRGQLRQARTEGHWAIPGASGRVLALPAWLARAFMKAYAHRPGLDMATLMFSHIERFPGQADFFSKIEKLEFVTSLHDHHPISVVAISDGSRTTLGLTWDPAQFTDQASREFAATIERHWNQALQEFEAFA